jgi:mono/diheme cytochrome c family protein
MRTATWLGPIILIVGLVLGAFAARGMYVAEANTRARITPEAVGPVEPPAPVSLQVGTGDPTKGRPKYEDKCSGCHGINGKGNPPLHGPLLNVYYPDDRLLTGIIRNGVGTMPGIPPDKLSDQDAADVIAFIRALR